MSARHVDRIWFMIGGLGAVALLAIGWFLLIGPQRSETSALQDQIADAETRVTGLRQSLHQLSEQQRNKQQYVDELAENREALPSTADTAELVRQINTSANAAAVKVTNIAITEPTKVKNSKLPIYSLSVAISAEGTDAKIDKFLNQLQEVQKRAVLIDSANVASTEDGKGSGRSLQITLQTYVSPAAGAQPAASPAAASSK